MTPDPLESLIRDIAVKALAASRQLATLSSAQKDAALAQLSAKLKDPDAVACLLAANRKDLEAGQANGLSEALLDRLRIDRKRIDAMVAGIEQVRALPDPVGDILETYHHPDGFRIDKVRVPIGVVGIVYESRPNVTIDCAVLCLKSGNAAILRGGKEALYSNRALAALITAALRASDLPAAAVQLIPTTERRALEVLLRADDCVHCLIPRGGESLIRFVAEHARMPVIKHYTGVCNVYIDAAADPAKAIAITLNAKCQRPGVCNAAENLLVHRSLLTTQWPQLAAALCAEGVELRLDEACGAALAGSGLPWQSASDEDYRTEFLAKILSVKAVDSVDEAVAFIHHYGSGHSDAIVTEDAACAEYFLQSVDTAAVYWNVSTRFTDGFEFGMGAEIGISTDRLHARGPMGLRELCSYKFVARGSGNVRS